MKKRLIVESHQFEDGDVVVAVIKDPAGIFRRFSIEREVPTWKPDGDGWVERLSTEATLDGHETVMHFSADPSPVIRRWSRPA